MNAIRKFIVGLFVALILNSAAVAHAEDIDPYFAWEIKNLDDYQQHDTLFKLIHDNGFVGARDAIYEWINEGRYALAIGMCREIETCQKVAFGTDYFDASLTELTAKLYLEEYEFDAAKRKINFLSNNATDNLSRIRALNLKSDLLNRRGNFREALQVTQEFDELLKSTPDEKLSLIAQSRMARAYCGLGDVQKSLELAEKIYPQMQDTFGESGIDTLALMSTLVDDYCKMQDQLNALEISLDKMHLMVDAYADNTVITAKTYAEIADTYFALGYTDEGKDFLNDALDFLMEDSAVDTNPYLCRAINKIAIKNLPADNPVVLKSALVLIKVNCLNINDIPQSIELCKENLPKFKKVFGEQSDETYALMSYLKYNYIDLGRYSDAKKITDEILIINKKYLGENDFSTLENTIDLADVYCRMGRYKTADKLLDDLQSRKGKILEKFPDLIKSFWLTKAKIARMNGALVNADEFLDKAESVIPEDIDDVDAERSKLHFMFGLTTNPFDGNVLDLGFYQSLGVEYNREAFEMMNDLAESAVAYGNLREAERYVNRILNLSKSRAGENNLQEWRALNTLSKIQRAEGNFAESLKTDNRALQVAETVCGKNSLERFQSLDAIASDHATSDNFIEAIKIREQALAQYKKILEDTDAITIQTMTNLAENYVAVGRYADALKLCDKTLALQKVPVYINDKINYYPSVTELIRIKATAQRLSGDNVNAYSNYKDLIQVYEGRRFLFTTSSIAASSESENQKQWFASIIPVYRDAASVAASDDVGDTNLAFYCAEFCKGRSLIDRFDDVLTAKDYLLTPAEKQKLANEQMLIHSWRDVAAYAVATNDDALLFEAESYYELSSLSARLSKGNLRKKYSDNMISKGFRKPVAEGIYMTVKKQENPFGWDEILKNFDVEKNRKAIPDGACLIEFLKVSDDLLLVTFLRNEGDVQAANIHVDKKFFEDCKLYHEFNSLSDDSNLEFNEELKNISDELSEKLMPTLEKFAGSSACWIISPDAELNLVPFETLTYHDKLLIESKDVSYVPSLAVMNLMRNRERKNSYLGRSKELFAMGDAIYSNNSSSAARGNRSAILNKDWTDLPGTAQELDKVSALFKSKEIFRREQATEKNLRELNRSGELSKYKYLLFAAHGMFVPDKPEYSSIVLGQQGTDEDNDGYVTVGEWMGYDLRSNLIYLSACESGLGVEQAGEGIVGIPYALTVAGNKDTVMSLWKVNDAATAEFTSAVFEKLRRGQSEISALNETKREFLRHDNPSYKNPSIWAAFLLYGI